MHTAILPLPSGDASLPTVLRPPVAPAQRKFDSRSLFGEAQEVRITHFGQEYRLRRTRNGKLILTK